MNDLIKLGLMIMIFINLLMGFAIYDSNKEIKKNTNNINQIVSFLNQAVEQAKNQQSTK